VSLPSNLSPSHIPLVDLDKNY